MSYFVHPRPFQGMVLPAVPTRREVLDVERGMTEGILGCHSGVESEVGRPGRHETVRQAGGPIRVVPGRAGAKNPADVEAS